MNVASIQIRDAQPDEVTELEQLQWRASLVWDEYREDLEAHPDEIEVSSRDIAAGNVRVAEGDGGVLGFFVLCDRAGDAAELDGLFVEPDAMRRGIGRSLIADAVALARSRGCARVEVTANPRAVDFYVKTGFVDDGVVQTRFGPGLRMHLAVER
ncbi:MAG TPA: GNAT family N-acetyltransferase [Candidatus Dormibacteraeota bacterium]